MAKKKPITNQQKKNIKTLANNPGSTKKEMFLLALALFATFIVYFGSLKNDLILNWDDGGYIVQHKLIQNLSFNNVKAIFTVFYKGNYHPLTTLFYTFEYSIAGTKPFIYHLNNLILHLANLILVFVFIKKLFNNIEIAFIVAFLFGIHPMHVESVAWISERKDVLYTFFFLLSLLYYIKFFSDKTKRKKHYILALICFLFSLLSKSAAVTLPVVFLLIDYYNQRKWKWKILYEKTPFFFLSIVFGLIAVYSQDSAGAIQDLTPLYTFFERIMIASYATLIYFIKLFVPINLSAMYPYPDKTGGGLPLLFQLAPIGVLLIAFITIYSLKFGRIFFFGIMLFFITISLVIQLIPVGGAIVAERYTYVPYIGLFLIIGHGYAYIKEKKAGFLKTIKPFLTIIVIGYFVFLSVLSVNRIRKWENGEVLFTDMIRIYPNLPFAYTNRGFLYFSFLKDYDKALADYSKSIQLNSNYHNAYSNRGVLYYNMAENAKKTGTIKEPKILDSIYRLSVNDFNSALLYKSDNVDAIIGRANAYSTLKIFDKAIPDYNKYISIFPDSSKAYLWRSIAFNNLGKYKEALNDVNMCISLSPKDDNAYFWRGLTYYQLNEYTNALQDLNLSLNLNPNQTEIYAWRGLAHYQNKNYNEAIADYNQALLLNPTDASIYVNRSLAYDKIGNYTQSFKDICAAGDMGYPLNKEYFMLLKSRAGK